MISDFIDQTWMDKMSTGPNEAPGRRRRRGVRNQPKPLGRKETEIQDLNDDCLIHIFSFLSIIDRVRLQRVCRRWNTISLIAWQTLKVMNFQEDFWGINSKYKIIIDRCVFIKILEWCGRFLTHIDLSSEILKNKNIRIVSCKAIFNMIADTCPNIRSINVGCPKSISTIEYIAYHFDNLTEITIQVPNYEYSSSLAELFLNHKNLIHLKLVESKISSTCLLNLNFENLKELHMDMCIFETPQSILNIIYNLKALHSLSIVHCYTKKLWKKDVVQALGSLTGLKKLNLAMSNDGYELIDADFINDLANLEELSVSGNEIANDEVLDKISCKCRNIKNLQIADSDDITNEGIFYIASLPNLQYLRINTLKKITCENLDKLSQVKSLECSLCPRMKNEGFINLISSSTKIRSIKIQDCEEINEELINNINIIASEKLDLLLDNSKISDILVTNKLSLAKAENQITKKFEKCCIYCYKEPVKNCVNCCNNVVVS